MAPGLQGMASSVEFSSRFEQVILFGDSITQFGFSPSDSGWCAVLANHFQRRVDFINRGFSGYTTRWAKHILPHLVNEQNKPDIIVLFFGANDAATNTTQGIPIDEYSANIIEMCSYLNRIGLDNSSIILVTPPPVCEMSCKAMRSTLDRSSTAAQQYAARVIDLGMSLGITVADIFHEISGKEDFRKYLSDGLHLSALGNEVVGELLIELLDDKLKGQHAVFPQWTEMSVEGVLNQFRHNVIISTRWE